jgi:hypothetical protein
MHLFSYFVIDTVIVPETPGPSRTKPKDVVIVQESPCSVSDMNSSFGLTNTGKSDVLRRAKSAGVLIGENKESENHPEVKQDADDSISEAETQCDIDCLDMTKCSVNTLHVSSVSHKDSVYARESDQEEDLFGAETQCEEPSLKVSVKSCSAGYQKNENIALKSEIIDAVDDDIYEAEKQRVLDDIPSERIKVGVVSEGNLDSKNSNSFEEDNINICNAGRVCKTEHLASQDTDDSSTEHNDEIYDAPTQCIPGNGDKTTVMGKTDTVSVCRGQTEEYSCDDVNLSSRKEINIKLSVDRKVDITDSSILLEGKGVGSENKVGEASSSDKDDKQREQQGSEGSSKVTKIMLDVSFNEDSFDRSFLEGDDDVFTFEGMHIIGSEEKVFKNSNTAKTVRELHQKGNKSKSGSTNSNNSGTNLVSLSKEYTSKPLSSEKTVSGCGVSEKCISNKSELVQTQSDSGKKTGILDVRAGNTVPLIKSLSTSIKETSKMSNESGDETDPEDIFEAKAQNGVSLNRNKNDNRSSSVRRSSGTPITSSSNNSKLCAQMCNDSGDETDPEDIFEAKTQIFSPPVHSKIVSKHSEPSSSKISSETSVAVNSGTQSLTESRNAEDQDRIFEIQNQGIVSHNKKNREFTNPEVLSKQDLCKAFTDKPAVSRAKKGATPTQLSIEFKDNNSDDEICYAPTQVLPIQNENIHITKLSVSLTKEMTDSIVTIPTQLHCASRYHDSGGGNGDNDDAIVKAATQIVATPNISNKDSTNISEPSSETEITDIQVISDNDRSIQEKATASDIKKTEKVKASTQLDNAAVVGDDDIFEAPTQIIEAPTKNNKDSSIGKVKINAPAVKYSGRVMVPKVVDSCSGSENDNILEIPAQKVEIPNNNGKDFPKHAGSSSGKQSYCTSEQMSFGTGDDPVKDIYDAPTQKIDDRTPKEILCDGAAIVASEMGSKKESDFGLHRQKKDQTIVTNGGATIKHSSKLFKDSSDKTAAADIRISSAEKINFPDRSTTEDEGISKFEMRESCFTESNEEEFENVRPTKVSATTDVQSGCDKWSGIGIQKSAEVIPQNDSNEVPEMEARKKVFDMTASGQMDAHKKVEGPVSSSASIRRDSNGKLKVVVSRKTDEMKVTSEEGRVEKSGTVESVRPDTRKPKVKKTKKPHDSAFRAGKARTGKPGMEESEKPRVPTACVQNENDSTLGMAEPKKSNYSVVGTQRDGGRTFSMNESIKSGDYMASEQRYFSGRPVITDSEKPSNIMRTQEEVDQKCEIAGSEIPGDNKSSIHDGSGDETDPENFFETNLHKIKVEGSPNNTLNIVKKCTVPVASGETVQSGHKNEAVVVLSAVLQDTVPSSVSTTENQNESTQATGYIDPSTPLQLIKMTTKSPCLNVSCSKEDTVVACGSDITPVLTLAASHDNSELVDFGSNSASCQTKVSAFSNTRAAMSSLPQNQSTNNGDQKQSSDLQKSMLPDHSKDTDESGKIPIGSTVVELDNKSLEADNFCNQKEYDPKSHHDINHQISLEHKRPIFEEGGRVVDATDELIDDSLNETFELIMPSSQDLMKAVKKSEAEESPFKPEEVIPSEDEEPSSPTYKITERSPLPNKRAKVRKRHSTESRGSDTTVVGRRRRHLSGKSSAHVSTSDITAGASRRRKLSYEDIVQSDTSNITLQTSKKRKLSEKNFLQNDSKNKADDVTSPRRSHRCRGESRQIETEDVVNTDKGNSGKGRKSKIVKGQDGTVASASFHKDTNVKPSPEGSRRGRSSCSKVERNEKEVQDLKSEHSNEPREGRRRLKQVVELTKGNEYEQTGKSRRERSVNKREDVEDALSASSRPSRKLKMTWKIQDSLGSDNSQGSITPGKGKSKGRSRGSLSSKSENEINENLGFSASKTSRSRNVSPNKSSPNKLLKNLEDSSNDTCKDIIENKITHFVSDQQSVSLRKSTRQSKGDRAVRTMSDISKNQPPQKMARQNDTETVNSREQKWKSKEMVTETAFRYTKRVKYQETSADRCCAETSKSVLNTDESLKDASRESSTRVSGRKRSQAGNVEVTQESSTVITDTQTLLTGNGKQSPVLKSVSGPSIDSDQSYTRRSIRKKMAVTNTSLACLKEVHTSVFLNASSRPQRGVTHAKSILEKDVEHLLAKRPKSEKRLSVTHSPSFESSVQKDEVQSVQSPRTSTTRREIMSRQKSATTGAAKQDIEPGQRERTSRILKTDEAYKELKNESLTPKLCKMSLSEDQDTTPQHVRSNQARGTPQRSSRRSIQRVSVTIVIVCEDRRKNMHGY